MSHKMLEENEEGRMLCTNKAKLEKIPDTRKDVDACCHTYTVCRIDCLWARHLAPYGQVVTLRWSFSVIAARLHVRVNRRCVSRGGRLTKRKIFWTVPKDSHDDSPRIVHCSPIRFKIGWMSRPKWYNHPYPISSLCPGCDMDRWDGGTCGQFKKHGNDNNLFTRIELVVLDQGKVLKWHYVTSTAVTTMYKTYIGSTTKCKAGNRKHHGCHFCYQYHPDTNTTRRVRSFKKIM